MYQENGNNLVKVKEIYLFTKNLGYSKGILPNKNLETTKNREEKLNIFLWRMYANDLRERLANDVFAFSVSFCVTRFISKVMHTAARSRLNAAI